MDIRHRASSAGRDQLPAGPPLPLGNDQGPRGRMTQDGHRPEVIIGHPPPFPKISGDSRGFPPNLFLHHFFAASKTTPRPSFGTKNEPKVAPKNTENDKKHAPGRSPRKVSQNTQNIEPTGPWNLRFHMECIAKSLFPRFTQNPSESPKNTPKIKQKSMK